MAATKCCRAIYDRAAILAFVFGYAVTVANTDTNAYSFTFCSEASQQAIKGN